MTDLSSSCCDSRPSRRLVLLDLLTLSFHPFVLVRGDAKSDLRHFRLPMSILTSYHSKPPPFQHISAMQFVAPRYLPSAGCVPHVFPPAGWFVLLVASSLP